MLNYMLNAMMILRNLSPKSLFCLLLLIAVNMWLLLYLLTISDDMATIWSIARHGGRNKYTKYYSKDIKRILSWGEYYLVRRENPFLKHNCSVKNCILTDDVNYMKNVTQFDAIIFFEPELESKYKPKVRSPSQVYIFSSIESAYNKPACELYNDDFFNWTFTYRLDSDIVWPYFCVRNLTGHVVAPTLTPSWQISPGPLDPKLKAILRKKSKGAAWMVSHCQADSLRDDFLSSLQEELSEYSLHIDVYGDCSKKKCGKDKECEKMLRRDYYFYMAFENSLSADYVTEKVMHGYASYAVPIVYGGANYTRFLPPGSYINALEMGPHKLAVTIREAIKNPDIYEKYFYYTNLYHFDADIHNDRNSFPSENHPLCDLCKALNDKNMTRPRPAIKNFRIWWNGLNGMKWCLPDEYWNETSLINTDIQHLLVGQA